MWTIGTDTTVVGLEINSFITIIKIAFCIPDTITEFNIGYCSHNFESYNNDSTSNYTIIGSLKEVVSEPISGYKTINFSIPLMR